MENFKRSKFVQSIGKQLDLRDNFEVPNWQIFTILFTGAVIVVINQMAMNTALPVMIDSIGVTPSLGQWIVSGYTLVKGIMVPITAFAMTKYRTRNLFNLMLGLFSIGSFAAALGLNFPVVVFGTVIQGVAAGMILPIMQTVLLTVMPVEQRGSAMGLMGGIMGIGPAFGPIVGGVIVDLFTWNVLFLMWGLITLLLIPLSWLVLPDVLPNSDLKIQWKNIRDSLIGFGLLLYSLSIFGSSGFRSIIAWVSLIVGLIFTYKFIRFNLDADQPMLNIKLFKNRDYRIAVIVATLAIMIINGVSTVVPIYIQTVRGLGATVAGLVLMPAGLVKTVLTPISGRLFDKLGVGVLGFVGGVLLVVGSVLLVTLSPQTPLFLVVLYISLIYAGFGIFNIPITTLGMNVLPKEDMGHATSVRQTVRQISSSFSISLTFIIMTLMTAFSSDLSFNQLATSENTMINIGGARAGFALIAIFAILALILIVYLSSLTKKRKQA